MKKVFFLSLMLAMCLVSNAFAFDESAWDLEERIYLGEFSLGKAELTNVMSHGILRLGGLPDGRFVRISVRTNRIGNIDLNTQLVEKREQTIISALRRIIPESKLPKANVEIFAGRYDQDGVDAQGAWIEVYKPRQTVYVPWAKLSPHKVTMEDYKKPVDDGVFTKDEQDIVIVFTVIGYFVLLCALIVIMKRMNKNMKKLKSPNMTLEMAKSPLERLNSLTEISAAEFEKMRSKCDVSTVVNINDDTAIGIIGHIFADKEYPAFDICKTGVRHPTTEKKWKQSVRLTVRHWLSGNDKNSDGDVRDFSRLIEAREIKDVMRIK